VLARDYIGIALAALGIVLGTWAGRDYLPIVIIGGVSMAVIIAWLAIVFRRQAQKPSRR
jgi:hypothetical protein